MTKLIAFNREVLLVEVERWCREPTCGARSRLPLTKQEARAYTGFECERCGRRFRDSLSERDIPEWWEELNIASLRGLKPAPEDARARRKAVEKNLKAVEKRAVGKRGKEEDDAGDSGEVVSRMSDAWRRLGGERESAPEVADAGRGESS